MPTLIINQCIGLSTYGCDFDFDWIKLINHDSNIVATVKQMHISSYNTSCFKYAYEKDR